MGNYPVIQRPMVFKFKRAQRMRDTFQRVLDRVRKIVHRVDAPRRSRAMMRHMIDAVNHRITHIEVSGI